MNVTLTSEKYPPFTVTLPELTTAPERGSLKGPTTYTPEESSVLNLPLTSVTTVFIKLLFESEILISTKETGLPSKVTEPKIPETNRIGVGVGVGINIGGKGVGVMGGNGVTEGLINTVGVGEEIESETNAP